MFPIIPANSAASFPANDEGIFGFGSGSQTAVTNLVSNAGVVSTDVAGVGQARLGLAACEYGGDKGIFGFGIYDGASPNTRCSITNLVSNAGVVATDQAATTGTGRNETSACSYGGDKGIFGFGSTGGGGGNLDATNLVSNAGVVADDVTGVGTARRLLAACEFGGDKGIFGYGYDDSAPVVGMTNLVSNAGVVASDTTGVGSVRYSPGACGYGDDKGIFAYGNDGCWGCVVSMSNKVSNTGVVADDVTGVGTARDYIAACEYGQDKGIFGYGEDAGPSGGGFLAISNLVSNGGVIADDQAAVTGTARYALGACSFN